MQAAMRSGFFDAFDGMKLYAEWHAPEGTPRAGAVIAHGFADHGGRYAEVGRRLAAAGFAAMAFDYRGHGQAGGRRGHCDRFEEYLADLDRAHGRVKAAVGDRPIVLVAHSHGGLMALRSLTDPVRPTRFAAAVLSSPFLGVAMKVPSWKAIVGRGMSRIWPRLAMPHGIDVNHLTHDREVVGASERDRYRHGVATARWFTEMQSAQAWVEQYAARLTIPTLWLVAGADRLVDVAASRRVFEKAGGDKTMSVYDGFYHEVFNELGRETVFRDMESWLSARFPVAQPA